ncbi:MAG: hypothetical protein AB7E60_03330 [Sphingobium sp.]
MTDPIGDTSVSEPDRIADDLEDNDPVWNPACRAAAPYRRQDGMNNPRGAV